jgi:hypothetical protein
MTAFLEPGEAEWLRSAFTSENEPLINHELSADD